jgi:plastocyanin
MTRILVAALAAGALAVAGCGSDDNGSSSSDTGAAAPSTTTSTPTPTPTTESTESTSSSESSSSSGKEVDIDMRNIAFDPKQITVKVGQKIKWENYDAVDHNVVATKGDDFKSKNFGKGGEYEYTVDKPGTITYVCTLHPGMEGTIAVTQ